MQILQLAGALLAILIMVLALYSTTTGRWFPIRAVRPPARASPFSIRLHGVSGLLLGAALLLQLAAPEPKKVWVLLVMLLFLGVAVINTVWSLRHLGN
jgi:hypothetical protein